MENKINTKQKKKRGELADSKIRADYIEQNHFKLKVNFMMGFTIAFQKTETAPKLHIGR